jgi:hypothetical protein
MKWFAAAVFLALNVGCCIPMTPVEARSDSGNNVVAQTAQDRWPVVGNFAAGSPEANLLAEVQYAREIYPSISVIHFYSGTGGAVTPRIAFSGNSTVMMWAEGAGSLKSELQDYGWVMGTGYRTWAISGSSCSFTISTQGRWALATYSRPEWQPNHPRC